MHNRNNIEKKFWGTWQLISYIIDMGDEKPFYPLGKNAKGCISYDANGQMSVTAMSDKHLSFASDNYFSGTKQEKANAYDQYLSYCGTYEVDDEKITHNIEVSLYPNWVNTNVTRYYKFFDNNKLELKTSEMSLANGQNITAKLIWQKI